MPCPGCYKEQSRSAYCSDCRRKLFDGVKIPHVLGFNPPSYANFQLYREHISRISIPGAQLKCSLMLKDDELMLSDIDIKGMYLLKPAPAASDMEEPDMLPENEHLTMQIAAKHFGIETAANALVFFKDHTPAYFTRRFDVEPDLTSLQQESFRQLLTDPHAGMTYEYIGRQMGKYIAAYMTAREKYFKLLLFNYLFSNGGAGQQAFSILRTARGEGVLAPAYNLVCSALHNPEAPDMALELYEGSRESGFYRKYGYYGIGDFLQFAQRLGILDSRAQAIADLVLSKEAEVTSMVSYSYLDELSKNRYLRLFREKLRRLTITYP